MPSADKDVEHLELPPIAVKWYNHSGKQMSGSFLQCKHCMGDRTQAFKP